MAQALEAMRQIGSRQSAVGMLTSVRPGGQTGGTGFGAAIAVTWLLIGPRIPLVLTQGSSVRLEDAILCALALVAAVGWRAASALRRPGIGLVTAAAIITALVGFIMGHVDAAPALLYAVRPFEYWIVYPALLTVLARNPVTGRRPIIRVLALVTLMQTATAFVQVVFGIDVGFSKFSYERGAGLTAGPYELGAICAALGCFWLARRQYVLLAIACGGLVLSSSRISLVAFVLAAVWLLLMRARNTRARGAQIPRMRLAAPTPPLGVAVVCGLLAALIGTSLIWYPSVAASSVERIQNTSVVTEWVVAGKAAENVGRAVRSDDYQTVAYTNFAEVMGDGFVAAQDASNLIRFFRWHLLLDALKPSWLVGLGPSFAGPSVDGAFLRILVETGVIGALAWLVLVRRLFAGSPTWVRAVLLTFIVGSSFIDIPFAMRPMVLMWTLLALSHADATSSGERAGGDDPRDA